MINPMRAYGLWSSPVSAKQVASSIRLNDVQWDGDTLLWHESRGSQGVIMSQTGVDAPREISGDLSVKGRVGYGGGEFTAYQGMIYFVANGRLYHQSLSSGSARPITPSFGGAASPAVSPEGHWIAYIHTDEGTDVLALVDRAGRHWPRKLLSGADFYMQPVWHPDGKQLAVVLWHHPYMPWDATELHLLTFNEQMEVANDTLVAGNQNTAIFQPAFSPDGRWLSYLSDSNKDTDTMQLYLVDLQVTDWDQQPTRRLSRSSEDHGAPAWVQGLRTYGWSPDSQSIISLRNSNGFFSLWRYPVDGSEPHGISGLEDYTYLYQPAISSTGKIAVIAASSGITPRIVSVDPAQPDQPPRIHRRTSAENIPASAYSQAEAVEWQVDDGETVYGKFYAPTSERFESGGKPPLIVMVHGGPSDQARARFEGEIQFFATRGFAVLAVNHRGSSGYGRAYLRKLYGQWGHYDVIDSISGLKWLAQQGRVDGERAAIMGGSAGGFTVLQALVDYPGIFRAGVCRYGISNQFALVQDTHKFEAHYSFSLLGNLPDANALFRQRSPIFHNERIQDALLIFQGGEDTVVPQSQSEAMVAALRERGVPVEYHLYPEEGHGFRDPANVEHYLKTTLNFLQTQLVYS
jgi:dipeptidyl aminopeptidase/acylaminoacyl peptidase